MATAHLHDDPSRTTPRGLIRYASEFYAAGEAADKALGEWPGYEIHAPVPVMFLMAQSIELSLKAFLLSSGVTLPTLRSKKFGHRLSACLKEAQARDLAKIIALLPDDQSVIAVVDDLYSSKQLQYMVIGMKTFPSYGPLQAVALKLLEGIAAHVGYPPYRLPHAL